MTRTYQNLAIRASSLSTADVADSSVDEITLNVVPESGRTSNYFAFLPNGSYAGQQLILNTTTIPDGIELNLTTNNSFSIMNTTNANTMVFPTASANQFGSVILQWTGYTWMVNCYNFAPNSLYLTNLF